MLPQGSKIERQEEHPRGSP